MYARTRVHNALKAEPTKRRRRPAQHHQHHDHVPPPPPPLPPPTRPQQHSVVHPPTPRTHSLSQVREVNCIIRQHHYPAIHSVIRPSPHTHTHIYALSHPPPHPRTKRTARVSDHNLFCICPPVCPELWHKVRYERRPCSDSDEKKRERERAKERERERETDRKEGGHTTAALIGHRANYTHFFSLTI